MTRRDVCDGVDSLRLPSFLLSTFSTALHEQCAVGEKTDPKKWACWVLGDDDLDRERGKSS